MHSTDTSTTSESRAPDSAVSASSVVHAEGVGRRFGRNWALAHVDLDVKTGESLLLVGANGSGKTTLLRLFCGLIRPSTGTLRLFDHAPLAQRFQVRPRITLVSHRTYLYEQFSALEHVRLWLGLAQEPTATVDQRALHLLETVGLAERAADAAGGFSAGMRKRLSLLRTRIENPDLILLDEPFSALDPAGQTMVTEWLAQLQAAGKTLVLASHALEQAKELCERAIVLRRGQIAWRGQACNVTPDLLESDR